jgi:prolyl oligopeptidase
MKKNKLYYLSLLSFSMLGMGACSTLETKENKPIPIASNPIASNEAVKTMSQEDKYLWLEEVEGEKSLAWVKGQNSRSLEKLQADSRYKPLEAEALAIIGAKDRLTFGGYNNGYVSNFWQDATQIRGVWRRAKFDGWKSGNPVWETILDFDKLSKDEGKNWVYKGASCLDPNNMWNTICLLSLSNGGKDANVKREFNAKTKSFVDGGFNIPEAKSDTTWIDKDTILIGTNWGEGTLTESGYPYIVKKLKRGQDLSSAQEIFRGEKTDVSAGAYRIDDGKKYHHIFYRNPTFFTSNSFYQAEDGQILPIDLPPKHTIVGIRDGQIYFSLQQDWNARQSEKLFLQGALLSAPISQLVAKTGAIIPKVIYSQAKGEALQGVEFTKSGILVTISKDVKSEIRFYSTNQAGDWSYSKVGLPQNGVAAISDASIHSDEVFYSYNDLLTPPSIFGAKNLNEAPKSVQSQSARFNAAGLEVAQFYAKSKDGTMVPYFIVHKKGIELNSQTPTLLYGYGGFEVSMLPNYSPYIGKMWLEKGGAYVLANIRGGGEFGPQWHEQGLKTSRQVVYDDFIAIAEDLIARKVTSPRRLGIMGGSNGGLLMGVMLTQRPELFNAVVVQVPLLDMLRYHKLLAGASWVDEYGSPDIPSERAWLEKLTPYQNLTKRSDFPEPLFVTSTKDDRVHPAHARKYAAKMEELGMPFLYYENIDGGHSAAANLVEGAKRRALEFTYLMEKLMD